MYAKARLNLLKKVTRNIMQVFGTIYPHKPCMITCDTGWNQEQPFDNCFGA